MKRPSQRLAANTTSLDLTAIDAVVSDLDGVAWRGSQVLPGAVALYNGLKQRGKRVVFATNNSAKTPADYVTRLSDMGVEGVVAHDIVTSGVVTAAYLTSHYPSGTPVHVLGSPALRSLIAGAGFVVVDEESPSAEAAPRVVVASIDRDLSYRRLAAASVTILAGADFIGTNADPNFPSEYGFLPGSGSIISALETATGRRATLMGKPEAPLFEHALRVAGSDPRRTLMIGDRLDTDILGAAKVSLLTALVLTGSTTAADLDGPAGEEVLGGPADTEDRPVGAHQEARPLPRPDLICGDLEELARILFG